MTDALGLVFFGSTKEQGQAELALLRQAATRVFRGWTVDESYSSRIICRALAEKGRQCLSPFALAARLYDAGAKRLFFASGFITDGHEQSDLCALVSGLRGLSGKYAFERIACSRPLLTDEQDGRAFAELIGEVFGSQLQRGPVVLMGHGTGHSGGNELYRVLARAMNGYHPDLHLACVEGEPDFQALKGHLIDRGVRRVTLAPLMTVFGDHAQNDLAGEGPGSWSSQLKESGIEPEIYRHGLAGCEAFRAYWVSRIKQDQEAAWSC